MTLAPGTRFGPYTLVSLLGTGGMGEVYRARDSRLSRDVALKVIPAAFAADADRLRRFEQEARAAGALQDPGICAVFDVGTADGTPYVVMELLEGETLRARLARGPLPWRKAVEYAAAVARAMAGAHGKGIIHRDLKPENLFLTRDGRIKILDFGLARVASPESGSVAGAETISSNRTESGVVLGTAGYMAPEQVRGGAADARSDIFALGAVAYEMLTGRRAFHGASFVETGHAILHQEVDVDSALVRELPSAVRRAVAHSLEKDPDARYASARDLAFHLDSILAADGGDSGAAPAVGPRRRRPTWTGPALLVATLALGTIVGALLAPRRGRSPEASSVHFPLLPPAGMTFQFFVEESVPFAISADGNRIAFVAVDSSGVTSAWVRSVGEIDARRLPGTERIHSLFWSPDGQSLGFHAAGAIKRYDFASSGVVTVCEVGTGVYYSGTWNSDGTILFAGGREGIIHRVAATGGAIRVVLRPNFAAGQSNLAWPRFLPDGRRFLYLQRRRDQADSLMIGDLTGTTHPLMPAASRAELAGASTLLYVKDGALVAQPFDAGGGRVTGGPTVIASGISNFATTGGALFAASGAGTIAWQRAGDRARLAWFDDRGDEHGSVGSRGDYLERMSLSRDGRRLLVARRRVDTGNYGLWLVDAVAGTDSRLSTEQITEAFPMWLPGEASYVFSSTSARGLPNLLRRDVESGVSTSLLPATGFQIANDVTADGRTLLYSEYPSPGVPHLWLLPLDGGKPVRLTTSQQTEHRGRFSPDGRLVATITADEERRVLRVLTRGGSGASGVVPTRGPLAARWSRDGRRLYILTDDGHMSAAVVRSTEPLDIGEPRVLFNLRGRLWRDFEVAPDGRLLAIVPEAVRDEEPVDVVVGWTPPR